MKIDLKDVVMTTFSSGSPWFPRTNGVMLTHVYTGETTQCSTERSQHANYSIAFKELVNRLSNTSQMELEF